MPHEPNTDVEHLLAMAAVRTREARAELAAVAADLFRPPERRLTDQQRAVMTDLLVKLADAIELELRQYLGEVLLRTAPDLAAIVGADAAMVAYPILAAAGRLRDLPLLQRLFQRAEAHRLALAAADADSGGAGADLLEALARSADPELARRAVAYVVAEARRRDRFGEPLLTRDDLPAGLAVDLHWRIAAALRRHLRDHPATESAPLDRAIEQAVRRALADHSEGQGIDARALRLAARLRELGELSDDLLCRSLAQGHLALFAGGLAARGDVAIDLVWQLLADRGHGSLLVLLRAIGTGAEAAAQIVERLDSGRPLARPPTALPALMAAYAALDPVDVRRQLHDWQLDAEFREAVADLDGRTPGS